MDLLWRFGCKWEKALELGGQTVNTVDTIDTVNKGIKGNSRVGQDQLVIILLMSLEKDVEGKISED